MYHLIDINFCGCCMFGFSNAWFPYRTLILHRTNKSKFSMFQSYHLFFSLWPINRTYDELNWMMYLSCHGITSPSLKKMSHYNWSSYCFSVTCNHKKHLQDVLCFYCDQSDIKMMKITHVEQWLVNMLKWYVVMCLWTHQRMFLTVIWSRSCVPQEWNYLTNYTSI